MYNSPALSVPCRFVLVSFSLQLIVLFSVGWSIKIIECMVAITLEFNKSLHKLYYFLIYLDPHWLTRGRLVGS